MSAASRIDELMQSLQDSLAALEAAQREGVASVATDPLRWAGVRHLAQLAIQACIDIADEILGYEGIEEPPRSRDVFEALAGAGLLDHGLALALADLVEFRNQLAHVYLRVTPAVVEARLPDILAHTRAFAQAVTDWLRRA